ncbi:MAG: SpoIIE family protein phosphatase [Anaerolineae bacterium]|nr:SpoIIE family protein phosphatase [Anaerolineae bacterium]
METIQIGKITLQDYAILVVDDNVTNLKVVVNYLKEFGFKMLTASSGESALKRIAAYPPDLILLDVMMPGMDGWEVCRQLKANPETANIPIIFMTALASEDDKVKGFDAGAVDYVTKPIQQREVLARVTTHLRLQEQARRLADMANSLQTANTEIQALNMRLQEENLRLEAELDITRRIQSMLLPGTEELAQIADLEIAGFMQPAAAVSGDYYDVLCHDGHIKISMGDVTGHGLESGLVMLMVQTAVRALLIGGLHDPVRFMDALNRTLYANLQRIGVNKSLSVTFLDYQQQTGQIGISGQHEQVLVLRKGGQIDILDTVNLGFYVGLVEEITAFVNEHTLTLAPGESAVLYSDGFTEAENANGEMYGLERLCASISDHWAESSAAIKEAAVTNVRLFLGERTPHDDLALLVIKKK